MGRARETLEGLASFRRLTREWIEPNIRSIDVAKIQREVKRLPAREWKKLTAWMVVEFPALSVEQLIAKATRAVKTGVFKPTPPTADNFPQGKTLEHALAIAGQIGLRK